MEFTRVFNTETADQEELLTVLELLLNEQPPAVAPAQVRDRFFGIGAQSSLTGLHFPAL